MSRELSRRSAGALVGGLVASATFAARTSAEQAHAGNDRAMDGWVDSRLAGMSLHDKVGQLFVTTFNGQSADEAMDKNRKEFGVATPAEIVRRYRVGGVIYFNNGDFDNIDTARQTAELSNGLQEAATGSHPGLPLLISTDQEGGSVARITAPHATEVPGNMPLGAGRRTEDAYAAAAILGAELRAMGINQNHAPDADVNTNPANPIIGLRSFSGDPKLTARMVRAAVGGYQRSGPPEATTSAAAKHFPGHGDAKADSHTGLPSIDRSLDDWRTIEAVPFRAAARAGVEEIMSAHIRMPRIDPSGEPATLSHRMITGLLREELGYDGMISTDSLRMQGVRDIHSDAEIPVLALKAGVDQLLMPVDLNLAVQAVLDAVHSGELTEKRIETSVRRILRMKYRRGLAHYAPVRLDELPHRVATPEHKASAQAITDRTITAVRNDAGLLPPDRKPATVLVTGWGETATTELAAAFGRRDAATTVRTTGTDPDKGQIEAAVAAANDADLTVVLTNGTSSGMGKQPGQQRLLEALAASGRPVVAVAAQLPYDTGFVDAQRTWLATYSAGAGSMESLAKVICGQLRPRGKLPVDVPDGENPKRTKYPFGTGLHW